MDLQKMDDLSLNSAEKMEYGILDRGNDIIMKYMAFSAECKLHLIAPKKTKIHGIQIRTQINIHSNSSTTYEENMLVLLQDNSGNKIASTYFEDIVNYDSLVDISFKKPIELQEQKRYCLVIKFLMGGRYLASQFNCVVSNFLIVESRDSAGVIAIIFS